jgi:hypothetical protein
MTQTEMKLNGYLFNTASLIEELIGWVSLRKLKRLTAEYIAQSGATASEIDRAMFRTCNLFNISVDV